MEELIKTMTYQEFKDWCSQRACDGRWWNSIEIITCLDIIKVVDEIKVTKGLFKKKKTLEAREEAFNSIKEVL